MHRCYISTEIAVCMLYNTRARRDSFIIVTLLPTLLMCTAFRLQHQLSTLPHSLLLLVFLTTCGMYYYRKKEEEEEEEYGIKGSRSESGSLYKEGIDGWMDRSL